MRTAEINRKTKETDIKLSINLDGTGKRSISTGIGFFDHMLDLFGAHSGYDFNVDCKGDLQVDFHHTVEDVGIILGQAIKSALGDKRGIARYSSAFIPMDETLTSVIVDVSGRPVLVYNCKILQNGSAGDFECQLVEEFFRAVAINAGLTLHINYLYGVNYHHIIESIFKGFAHAMKDATKVVSDEIPSSKGVLD